MSKLAAIGDPKELLSQFKVQVSALHIPASDVESAMGIITALRNKLQGADISVMREVLQNVEARFPGYHKAQYLAFSAMAKVSKYSGNAIVAGRKLFLSIVQSLSLPSALMKKVELATRFFMKEPKPRLKLHGEDRYLEMFDVYIKFMLTLTKYIELAELAVKSGSAHVEGATKIRVGSFVLVNTGGFSEKVMENVADIVKKAETFLKTSGLGEVCYGDVQVTNTLKRADTLAFYLVEKDELFIRANVKADTNTLHTVLHELGHRHMYKFLSSNKQQAVKNLYYAIKGQDRERKYDESLKNRLPKPGEVIRDKGKTYTVRETKFQDNGYMVYLDGEGGSRARVSLDGFLDMKGEAREVATNPNYKGFVTNYAGSSAVENYAEMFAFYCMGELPVLQSAAFEEILFGTSKTALDRSSHRVAAKYVNRGPLGKL